MNRFPQMRMNLALIPLMITLLALLPTHIDAQSASVSEPAQYETQTEWPGVVYQIVGAERIIQNRLMVVVRIQATAQTPAAGVFLGTPPAIPGGAPPKTKIEDLRAYYPTPFFLTGATMTDELTGTPYPQLPAITPPGVVYFPSAAIGLLLPGQMRVFSLQFEVPPPPPPPAPGQKPPPQTLSFVFPKAAKPIVHVPLPPLPQKTKTE